MKLIKKHYIIFCHTSTFDTVIYIYQLPNINLINNYA